MMRYIVHLLPEESRRRCLDDLRMKLAEIIGPNKALDYPTSHVTLVYNIQERSDDQSPIDVAQLGEWLETLRATGPIRLWPRSPEFHVSHLLMPVPESDGLTNLRRSAFVTVRDICGGPSGHHSQRAANVKEQTWAHLTLAQNIDADRARRALEYLEIHGRWASLPLLMNQVALIARNVDRNAPYRIGKLVTL
jgi:hypothetical protein